MASVSGGKNRAPRGARVTRDVLRDVTPQQAVAVLARAMLRILPTLQFPERYPVEHGRRMLEAIDFCAWTAGLAAFIGDAGWSPAFDAALAHAPSVIHLDESGVREQAAGRMAPMIARATRALMALDGTTQAPDARAAWPDRRILNDLSSAVQTATDLADEALAADASRAFEADLALLESSRDLYALGRLPFWPDNAPSGWNTVMEAWRDMLARFTLPGLYDRYVAAARGDFDWETPYGWVEKSSQRFQPQPEPSSVRQAALPNEPARRVPFRGRTSASKKSKAPADTVLFERDGMRISFLVQSDVWTLGHDAIVLPVASDGRSPGQFTSAFLEHTNESARQRVTKALSTAKVSPANPLRVDLGDDAPRPGPLAVIVTTASDPDPTPRHAARAAVEAVKRAAEGGFATIVLPLLGTGGGKLDASKVLRDMLRDLAREAPITGVTEIALVTLNARLRTAALGFAEELKWLESTPERASYGNDQETKDDSLKVREQARTFAKLLVARDTSMPLSLGLFGNWGAGKTYFMRLMQQEIGELTKCQKPEDDKSVYLRRVAQIEFNAWNYIDSNLWASLAIRLFDGLASEYAPDQTAAAIEAVRRELQKDAQSSERARQEAEKRQDNAKKELENATVELASLEAQRLAAARSYGIAFWKRFLKQPEIDRKVKRASKLARQLGWAEAISTGEDLAKLYRELRQLQGRWQALFHSIGFRFSSAGQTFIALGAIVAVAGLSAVAGPVMHWVAEYYLPGATALNANVLAWVGRIVAIVAPAIVWTGKQLHNVSAVTREVESVQAALAATDPVENASKEEETLRKKVDKLNADVRTQQEKIAEAERRITSAQQELQRINAGGLVYDFAAGRRTAAEYTSKLGIVSVIREDFDRLRTLLVDWHKHHEKERAPIERIILYIDDLDRCHPDQVVEVLQAVHLLLAFDLFAVVVAVDPRWLERSLYKAYAPDVDRIAEGNATRANEFSPQNYLEKIFQIPFSLPAMDSEGYERLIEAAIDSRSERNKADGLAPRPNGSGPSRDDAVANGGTADAAAGSVAQGDVLPPASTNFPTPSPELLPQPSPPAKAPPNPLPQQTPSSASGASRRGRVNDTAPVLEDWEKHFLQSLHPFVDTPRLAKRLVNIYRLLRVRSGSIEGDCFPDFIKREAGEYRAVQVLLAVNIGYPQIAVPLFQRILASKSKSWRQFVAELVEESSREDLDRFPGRKGDSDSVNDMVKCLSTMQAWLAKIEPRIEYPNDMAAYRRWAPEVGRYLFHWNLVVSPPPRVTSAK